MRVLISLGKYSNLEEWRTIALHERPATRFFGNEMLRYWHATPPGTRIISVSRTTPPLAMMKTIVVTLVVAITLVLGHAATGGDVLLNGIVTNLRSGRIAFLEMRFVPYGRLSVIATTPEIIDSEPKSLVLDIKNIDVNGLVNALDNSKIHLEERALDIKTSILFLSKDNTVLHSIYLDGRYVTGTGRRGIIDGKNVKLSVHIEKWVAGFREAFEASGK